MRKLLFFAVGLLFGALVGAALVALLTPTSGQEIRRDAEQQADNAVSLARTAAQKRRQQLEAELTALTSIPAKATRR